MTQPVQGIHHITAFASDPQRNVDFYTQILGQRFVKKTVNFDDPGTYHLYYGDKVGSPGTIMTFFPWPHARRGRRGVGEVVASAYSILPTSASYWKDRLTDHGVAFSTETRFGEEVIIFPDPDNMMIELVVHDGIPAPEHWANGPIPAEHALRAFHGVTIWTRDGADSGRLLTEIWGFTKVGSEGARTRFAGAGEYGQFVDFVVRTDIGRGQPGAGSVHHVAFRTVDDSEQQEWMAILRQVGLQVTPVQDRQYFHSIYFREPSGVLFEVATDAPGFPDDEEIAELGKSLKLPAWLERNRAQIEQALIPITVAEYA